MCMKTCTQYFNVLLPVGNKQISLSTKRIHLPLTS